MTPLLFGAFGAGGNAAALMYGGRAIILVGLVLGIGAAIYFSARSLGWSV